MIGIYGSPMECVGMGSNLIAMAEGDTLEPEGEHTNRATPSDAVRWAGERASSRRVGMASSEETGV